MTFSPPSLIRRALAPAASPSRGDPDRRSALRPVITCGLVCIIAAAFLRFANGLYPIRGWLFLTLLRLWLWNVFLVAACLTCGGFVLQRLLRDLRRSPLHDLSLSAAVGGLTFGLGMFAAGAAGMFSAWWAVLWPTVMLTVGVLGDRRRAPWLALLARQPSGSFPAPPPSWLIGPATTFGGLCLGLLYLGVLSPEAVSYDAAWTHLAIAQDYAREGRIVPFPADWPKNLAHLGSVINTWAFLVPGLGDAPQVRWMFALHIEFTFFLFTLAGIAAAIERVIGHRVRAAWVWLLLFPGVFVYDGTMGGGSDHFAAFFAPPLLLAGIEAAHTRDRRWWVLFGALAGGALVTKYQSLYFVAAIAVLPGFAWVRARPSVRTIGEPVAAIATAALVSAPHFVRNCVFYKNPLYPFAQSWFVHSTPQYPGSATLPQQIIAHFGARAPDDLKRRLFEAVKLTFRFAFETHAGFTGKLPVFGTLFVLTVPFVLVLRRGQRPWQAVVPALLSVFLWAATYRIDRNLQALAPLLAVATGAVAIRVWQQGAVERAAISVLVALQLVWGGDHYFLRSSVDSALSLIRSGYEGRAANRFDGFGADRVAINKALPADAKVLLHNDHLNLGIDRPILLDWLGFQGLIDMRLYRTPRELYQRYHELGVTHVVSHPGQHRAPTQQEEVVFAAFADRYRDQTQTFGALRLLALPAAPPPVETPYTVLALAIPGYRDGVYPVERMAVSPDLPPTGEAPPIPTIAADITSAAAHLAAVNAVLLGDKARQLADHDDLKRRFRRVTDYPGVSVWLVTP